MPETQTKTPMYWKASVMGGKRPNAAILRVRSVCCDRPMFAEDVRCPECKRDCRYIWDEATRTYLTGSRGQKIRSGHYPTPEQGSTSLEEAMRS